MNPIARIGLTLLAFILLVFLFAILNPKIVDVTESVRISGDRKAIWQAVTDFEGTFHDSNPAHISTVITSQPKTPFRSGLEFAQEETVGGIRGILDGRVYDVLEEHHYRWEASTRYFVGNWSFATVDEGGEVRIEPVPEEGVYRLVHRVYGHFPDTVWGRVLSWFSASLAGMESDARKHTLKELMYVKEAIEGRRNE